MSARVMNDSESMQSTQDRDGEINWRHSNSSAIRNAKAASSIQTQETATQVIFKSIDNRPDAARVQLILCNISDRIVLYRLRCSANTHVSALPSGSGRVEPRSSTRIILTWHRPKTIQKWFMAPQPRMVLLTRFARNNNRPVEINSTRLIGYICEQGFCTAGNPPTTQLLLDATSAMECTSEEDEEVNNGWMNRTSSTVMRRNVEQSFIGRLRDIFMIDSWENLAIIIFVVIFLMHFIVNFLAIKSTTRSIKLSQQ